MKLKINHFEPFIFLPLGIVQEKLFYANSELKTEYGLLREMIFSNIENEIIADNIIRIFNCKNNIIIAHIYPLQYKEKISGRGGQVMVIGYIISKKLLKKYYKGVVYRIDVFFKSIEQIVRMEFNQNTKDIVTDFVKLVNDKKYDTQKIVNKLEECVQRCNNNWSGYNWSGCPKFIELHFKRRTRHTKIISGSNNLWDIYTYMKEIRFKTCILLFNCINYKQYTFFKKEKFVSLVFAKTN